MKATLTIEVPDDFKKGACDICPISYYQLPFIQHKNVMCQNASENCPLEIREEPIIEDSKLYRIMDVYRNCNGCKCKWGYDESGYVLCKSPNCIEKGE